MLDECTKAMLDHTILRNEGIGTWGKKKKLSSLQLGKRNGGKKVGEIYPRGKPLERVKELV